MDSNKRLICKCLGGSHSYGLSTPASDEDLRGVFLFENVGYLVGIDKKGEFIEDRKDGNDVFYHEFRHFLDLCRKTNTQALELLFNEHWLEIDPAFKVVQQFKTKLLDSERLFKSLRGYMQGELRLANGERTGLLGGKRKESLAKYGFSPKNFVQLFRLAFAGKTFFEKGYFPVNIADEKPEFAKELLDLKVNPEKYKVEDLNKRVHDDEVSLENSYNNRSFDYKFDEEVANHLCLNAYMEYLRKYQDNLLYTE